MEDRFFNFPIVLLDGFLEDLERVLENIWDYSIYTRTLSYDFGSMKTKIEDAKNYFGVNGGLDTRITGNGKELYEEYKSFAHTGISKKIYFDYLKNDKTKEQKLQLLGFLALKSIIGSRSYFKTNNLLVLSRMAGLPETAKKIEELPSGFYHLNTRYQMDKLKENLKDSWGLIIYGRYIRGFYFSFNMKREDLIFEAEKNRKSNKEKARKKKEEEEYKRAIQRLNSLN